MNSKLILIAIVTVIFLGVVGVFEYLHRQADIEPVSVPANILAPINTSLDLSFIEKLEGRETNQLGTDLGF